MCFQLTHAVEHQKERQMRLFAKESENKLTCLINVCHISIVSASVRQWETSYSVLGFTFEETEVTTNRWG